MRHHLLFDFLPIFFFGTSTFYTQPMYYSKGTRWTELLLDKLLYDSWYEKTATEGKVSNKPNFEVVGYYAGEEYKDDLNTRRLLLHEIYEKRRLGNG